MNSKKSLYPPYIILGILYIFIIIFALIVDKPIEIFQGMKNIIYTSDILISDYVEIGGIGATLVNASLTSLLSLLLLIFVGIKPNGSTIMSLWLMTGFSFFGKNIFNIWPIVLGVYLFSKYQKEPFLNYILVALLGTTLSPVVSQVSLGVRFPTLVSIFLGIFLGVFVGFILPPIASYTVKAHNGYNLYNIGFAGGLIATVVMSIFRALGINFESRLIWNSESTMTLFIFLMIVCIYLIIVGLIYGQNLKDNLINLTKQNGRLISDFYILFGPSTYINMGVLGIISTLFVVLIGGDLNGATMGAIFTIIGFGAFGKNIKNIVPIVIGATLAGLFNLNKISSPNLILPILFSTALAPIAGKFGFKAGMLAGILHVSIVSSIGYLHGGLNLYNNGLAGGFVAMILIPLITAFKKEI